MMMKKTIFYFAAMASIVLASCTSDELTGSSPTTNTVKNEGTPIMFSSMNKGFTRADFVGSDAATKLANKFVVSAKKGSETKATTSPITFNNYLVEYAENTAHTTASNVANWEYVGKTPIKHATDAGITSQTIKYWDYSADQYDFIAWSAGSKIAVYEGTPAAGEVKVSAINPNATATGAVTFEGKAADLSEVYISDLVTVKKADYQNTVMMKFRSLGTKVRLGIYETVPGYSVRNVRFYTTGDVLTDKSTQIVNNATIYSAGADIYTEGTYTVTYPTVDTPTDANNNQAHVTFAPKSGADQATIVNWGGMNYTIAEEGERTPGNVYLGRTSATASFAGDEATNYYVTYLPNETGANLNLRVDFTLEAIDGGGEVIEVKNAKAQVPSIYTKWQPGFAYTYLFKISDKTNGRTGVYDPTQADDATVNSDPAGLYPITFDAVVVNAEDNDKTQETITTVMTPSITTYQSGSTVIDNNEYTTLTPDPSKGITGDIYVTVNENNTTVKLTGKANVYSIPAGKTEAEVIDALQMQDDDATGGTIKGRSGLVLTEVTCKLIGRVNYGVDGNSIIVGSDKVAYFTPTANTTYAFVYTKTAATPANNVVMYQALNWDNFATGQTKYRYDYKAPAATDAQKGVKYFAVAAGVYTKQTPFIGQGVGNLYLDAAGNTIAKGYAVTGTTYYYTTDHGMTYKAAHNVAYADFAGATDLYTFDGTTYTLKTDTAPVDGTAYYQKTTVGTEDVYTYCVILPQQTTGWFELDTTKYVVADEAAKVEGQTYFDKYIKNDGEYYTKVIKVQ